MEERIYKPTRKVVFDDVRVSDTIAIQTRSNIYKLLVINPLRAYGMLVGGILGLKPIEATLYTVRELKVGRPARLLIAQNDGRSKLLTTSPVKCLIHIKSR